MKHASLTLRLTALFVMVATAVLIGLAWVIQRAVEHHFAEQDFTEIHGKIELVRNLFGRAKSPAEIERLPRALADALVGHHELALSITVAGRPFFGRANGTLPLGPADFSPADELHGPEQLRVWDEGRAVYRGVVLQVPFGDPALTPATVAIAVDTHHHHEFMEGFRRTLIGVVVLGAVLMAALSWWVAHRGLLPLREMTVTAQGISASRLRQRIVVAKVPAELRNLAEAFNAMLARLEESFQRLSDFSSDLAHEIRTPISNLMTQTQVALTRSRSSAEYEDVLQSNLEEYERLARMVADMLFLAKADHGLIVPRREAIELGDEVRQLFDFYEALAEERGVVLASEGGGRIDGDRLMVRRALSNLLSNAVRHTPRGETIRVRCAPHAGRMRVAVENPGPTIAGEHLARIFDRFYRADPARQQASDGAGLGLAITKSIVEAHQGTLSATSERNLTTFTAEFPVSIRREA